MQPGRRGSGTVSNMRSNNLGSADLDLLAEVDRGNVRRDDQNGRRRGLWALYRLGDREVGMQLRRLRRLALVELPLVGPPRITADGRRALRE